jgi:hypothetical protein
MATIPMTGNTVRAPQPTEHTHLRFVKTGRVVDLTPELAKETWLWAMIEAGLIEQVAGTPHELPLAKAQARWWVEGEGKNATVTGYCPVCRQRQTVFQAGSDVKFEHCGATDHAPAEVLAGYRRARSIWR